MKKFILRRAGALVLALALTMAMALTAAPAWADAEDYTPDYTPVTGVSVYPNTLSLTKGGGGKLLTAVVMPYEATNKTVIWSTDDSDIATILSSGNTATIYPGKKAGTTTITVVAVGGTVEYTATCTVTVTTPVTGVTLYDSKDNTLDSTSNPLELKVGESEMLTAKVEPEDATDTRVNWSSDKTNVAIVNNGRVTAVAEGTATITATVGGVKATCTVNVTPVAVTGVTLTDSEGKRHSEDDPLELNVGATATLTATVSSADPDIEPTNQTVEWNSSDESVATVTNGTVKALKAGTTTITATSAENDNFKDTCEVHVIVPVTGVTLDMTELAFKLTGAESDKKTETLTATVVPGNATDKTVTWTSSDENIVTVACPDKDDTTKATVTVVKPGTATITAKAGDKTATCTVNVTVPVTGVTLQDPEDKDKTLNSESPPINLSVGGTVTLTAIVEPQEPYEATNKNVTWKSSDTAVATVSNGTVTARGLGEAEITVTTEDGNYTAKCKVTVSPVTVTGVKLDETKLTLEVGKSKTLKATVEPKDATNKNVTWASSNPDVVTVDPNSGKITANAVSKEPVIITVTTEEGKKTATCEVTVTPIAVTNVRLNKTSFSLQVGSTMELTATVAPENAADKTVTWTSSDENIVTVACPDKDDTTKATVTAKKVGTATITATAGGKTATCTVYVTDKPAPSISITGKNPLTTDPGKLTLTAELSNVTDANPKITWTVAFKSEQRKTTLPKLTGSGKTATLDSSTTGPGEFIVTATYTYKDDTGKDVTTDDTKSVTISGIVLSGQKLNTDKDNNNTVEMFVGDNTMLTVTSYGAADERNAPRAQWSSSDSSVVSVPEDSGNLYAWALGTAVIKATKDSYSAECTVNVVEDTSVIVTKDNDGKTLTASASEPLTLDKAYKELNNICLLKTEDYGLDYITNLQVVSIDQGTLYYNYSTEADTGDGVGYNDQFALTAGGGKLSLDKLYFVPRLGFNGTAEITFSAVAQNHRNIAGTIKVEVGTGSDSEAYQINYGARAGEPVWFLASDFSAFCRKVNSRDFNYVVFNLPKSSDGTLYYNYMAGSGSPVTTSIHFTPSGTYSLDSVCFVPNAALGNNSKVTISFRAVDTSGETVSGEVIVNVSAASVSDDSSSVMIFGEGGQPVALQSELFNAACKGTLDDTLSFVTFRLPSPTEGTLYYNYRSDGTYDSIVTEATRYYYSGVPGLNNVTFVPASGASGRVAISYTGYGSGGTSYAGTLYIGLDGGNSSTIRYSVEKSGSVTFNASDFNNAGLRQKGVGVNYVVFKLSNIVQVPGTGLGTLYYNYRSSTSHSSVGSASYYVSPSGTQRGLNLISFHAAGLTGTVTIPYEAVCGTGSNRQTFTGEVVIQVGSIAAADVNVSCSASGQVGLSTDRLDSVCGPVLGVSLSYIEITSVPDAKEGHLYLNYYGVGTGTAVKVGDRFYRAGSPGIDQLKFVPYARFTGEAEITYIGYSADGKERVSGRVIVNVTKSGTSAFNDMADYEWAIDSVEFLRQNGTVEGIGNGCYNPSGIITRGDFALMLVRAYGFTAAGSAPFDDVPDGKYYADAVRIAYLRGIVKGYNGNFNPEGPLTRQDAMVMIHNVLNISGKTSTNGLAADLSVYHDEGQIATYAREIMGNLVQMGVIEGDGGYLRPQRELTRAEAAILLHAIMTL